MGEDAERDLERMFGATIRRRRTGERIDDLEAYKRLLNLAGELERIAKIAWSPASAESLILAAAVARRLASKVYRRSIRVSD